MAGNTHSKVKKQMVNLEKIFATYIRDKGLMSLICKDPLDTEKRTTISSIRKAAKGDD